jgi:hypothetical protein
MFEIIFHHFKSKMSRYKVHVTTIRISVATVVIISVITIIIMHYNWKYDYKVHIIVIKFIVFNF